MYDGINHFIYDFVFVVRKIVEVMILIALQNIISHVGVFAVVKKLHEPC